VDVIRVLCKRQIFSPGKDGESGVLPAQPDAMTWVKAVLSRSTFGSGYAQQPFRSDDVVTRGQACALMAALTDKDTAAMQKP
jgi:hypothetical protein